MSDIPFFLRKCSTNFNDTLAAYSKNCTIKISKKLSETCKNHNFCRYEGSADKLFWPKVLRNGRNLKKFVLKISSKALETPMMALFTVKYYFLTESLGFLLFCLDFIQLAKMAGN